MEFKLVPISDQVAKLSKRLVITEVAALIVTRHDDRLMLGRRPVT